MLGRAISDDPRPATFADGVAGMAVIDAVRGSARDGGAWTAVGERGAGNRQDRQ